MHMPDTHTHHAKSLQLCLTLRDPMDHNPPGSSVHGILKAGILEWVAIPPPGDLPNPRIGRMSHVCLLHWQVGSLPLVPPEKSYTHTIIAYMTKYLRNQKVHKYMLILF